jgi:hypothetical protein
VLANNGENTAPGLGAYRGQLPPHAERIHGRHTGSCENGRQLAALDLSGRVRSNIVTACVEALQEPSRARPRAKSAGYRQIPAIPWAMWQRASTYPLVPHHGRHSTNSVALNAQRHHGASDVTRLKGRGRPSRCARCARRCIDGADKRGKNKGGAVNDSDTYAAAA